MFCCSPYVIGTMNQTSSTCPADLQVHHNFRWILYANHIEPVRSFLGRHLRRQLASATAKTAVADVPGPGSGLMVVERVVEWLPKVWQHVNRFLESQSNFDITIGLVRLCSNSIGLICCGLVEDWLYNSFLHQLHDALTRPDVVDLL